MLYSKQITIPANTTEANKYKIAFKVNKGMLSTFWVTFPSGCAGLARMRVYHEGHPFLPVNQDNFLRGNGFTFKFPVMFEIKEEPTNIYVEVWNLDETYAHTLDIQFLILPKWLILPIGSSEGIVAALKSMFVKRW